MRLFKNFLQHENPKIECEINVFITNCKLSLDKRLMYTTIKAFNGSLS
jgi:hypothetical protein